MSRRPPKHAQENNWHDAIALLFGHPAADSSELDIGMAKRTKGINCRVTDNEGATRAISFATKPDLEEWMRDPNNARTIITVPLTALPVLVPAGAKVLHTVPCLTLALPQFPSNSQAMA